MRRRAALGLLAVVLAVASGWLWRDHQEGASPPERPALTASELLGGSASGFRRADAPRQLHFPADAGAHPDYRHEWWYFTGNLVTPGGRRFGYEFTLFRFAIAPSMPPRASAWATRQIYMAHLAFTDVRGARFLARQRFARGALGLAGVQLHPYSLWLGDWRATAAGNGLWPLHVTAHTDTGALDLVLRPAKPLVLQGEKGLSRKGPQPGNASYYYSYTRLATRGRINLDGRAFNVAGNSWMDHEWGSSALGPTLAGWDWFAVQLDDGRDLMFYRLRRHDGSADPLSAGVLVARDGSYRSLGAADVSVAVTRHWTSPATGIRYPAGWQLRLRRERLALKIRPLLADQELNLAVRYWEGAVRVGGSDAGRPTAGVGYVELAGYGGASPSSQK